VDDEARRAFRDFVATRTPALMRTAYLLAGNQHDAEDLLQSALTEARPMLICDETSTAAGPAM
jgi:DNA-directed RNA polymerase specialized sigma24 family protein